MPSHPALHMPRWGQLTQEKGSMWWLRLYVLRMDPYPRAWWYRMFIWNCAAAVKMSLWWWEIARHIPSLLRKKTPVAREVTVTQIPELPVQIRLTEASEEDHGHQMPKLTVKQRQEKLFEELDLRGLESWPLELGASTQSFLAEYHNVFSLEPSELGCTHSTKHNQNYWWYPFKK